MRKLIVLFLFLSQFVFAAAAPAVLVLDEVSPKQLVKRVEILKKLAPKLRSSERKDYLADATALARRLSGISDFAGLTEADKNLVVTDFESLRTRAASIEEKICERVKRTGSNMTTTVCMTRQEREQIRADGQARSRDLQGVRAVESRD